MTVLHRRVIVCLSLATSLSTAAGSTPVDRHLGGFPVCEASSAVLTACPDDPARTCLLVGDNEQRQAIFAYPFCGHELAVGERSQVDLTALLADADDQQLSDIEGLTRLSSGEILVFGSHSRNKSCKRREKRRQFLGVRIEGGAATASSVPLVTTAKSFALAESIAADAAEPLLSVRTAIAAAEVHAEGQADADDDTEPSCPNAFNIEGVVALPGHDRDAVWVGLRSPLVDGKAVLLRQEAGLTSFAFDDARLIDLDGWGIRDLTYARGWIWGIAGPVPDDSVSSFVLWRFRADQMRGGETLRVEKLAQLPNSSEGLAIWGNTAIVLMDGDEPEIEGSQVCRENARYTTLWVPW